VSQSDLTDEDLLILRYLNAHDRYWAASKLAPLIDIAVVRAAERLEALEPVREGPYRAPFGTASGQRREAGGVCCRPPAPV